MSQEKPESAFIDGSVTETIRYTTNGKTFTEIIDVSLNGRTGLTKSITAKDQGVFFQKAENVLKNDELLEIAQNSTERNLAYNKAMNDRLNRANRSGSGEEFKAALNKNGTYDILVEDKTINDITIETQTSIDEKIKNQEEEAEETELKEFQKSIEVGGDYTYPVDMKWNEGQDYVFFEQFEYLPPQSTARSTDVDTLNNELGTVLSQGVGRGRNTGGTKRRHGSCKLPIPNKLGVSNGVNWGEGRANAVELSAFQSADRGIQDLIGGDGNVLKALKGAKDQAGNALNVVKGDLSTRSERTGENINAGDILSATLARSALGAIGINVDVDQFITRQTGAAINPNLELLFGGPQLRSFSFNFTFAPNDTIEAKEVRKIQRWFRQGMLPSRRRASQSSGSALFLASPNVFRICYKNQNRRIKGLNIIKICALTSCQIDFTPDGTYQSYDDVDGVSMPVRSTMGITFTELTPVFKDDYAENVESPSMLDLDMNVQGTNAIDENDIGI